MHHTTNSCICQLYCIYLKKGVILMTERKLVKKLLNFPNDLIDRIEDYQFQERKANFTAAVMDLIEEQLNIYENKEPAE